MNPLKSIACLAAGTVALVAMGALTFHAARNQVHTAGRVLAASSVRKPLLDYGELPLGFEPSNSQSDSRVQFLSRGRGYTLVLSRGEALLALKRASADQRPILAPGPSRHEGTRADTFLKMRLEGANSGAKPEGIDELPGRSNYLIGNDPSKWRVNVANYAGVRYEDIYPGVNLFYYGNRGRLEYDFVVAPGASTARIALGFASWSEGLASAGATVRGIDSNGDLVLAVDGSEVRFNKPIAYQLPRIIADSLVIAESGRAFSDHGHPRTIIESHWVMRPDGLVGFEMGPYDHRRPLVIDPTLAYSTFLGGSGADTGNAIAVDGAGNAYIAGATMSTDFPVLGNSPLHPCGTCAADEPTAFVSKLNSNGSALLYSTYIGGTGYGTGFFGDKAFGIAVDGQGNAYLAGGTDSVDFPVTPGAYKTNCPACSAGSTNAFVLKLNANGSALVYSTYVGGTGNSGNNGDSALAIAIDPTGDAYVTGYTFSDDFPISTGALQATCKDCANGTPVSFITKLNPDGSSLIYSTYLGGSNLYGEGGNGDIANAIAIDTAGEAFVAGEADTADFPATQGAFQHTRGQAGSSGFVARINSNATALVYATYLGGSTNGSIHALAIDGSGNAYTAGHTTSADFPYTGGAYQTACSGACDDAFVAKLNPEGSALVFSTFLGGTDTDNANAIAVDANGNSYVTGETRSSDFPHTSDAAQSLCDQTSAACSGDAFLTEVNATGSELLYSTFLGGSGEDAGLGIALDASPNVYLAGSTVSANFPVSSNAFQKSCGGNCMRASSNDPVPTDAFIAKFGTADAAGTLGLAIAPGSSSSATVAAGSTASYTLTIGGAGFTGTASLSCSGAPANSTCSVPGAASVSAAKASTVQVSVTTMGCSTAALQRPVTAPLVAGTTVMGLIFLPWRIRRKARLQWLALALAAGLITFTGCGGAASRVTGECQRTPTGTNTLTVTATAGSLVESTELSLTVQ